MQLDQQLEPEHRVFLYMPYMHSENLEDQARCVELCDARLEDENTVKSAMTHHDIIKRFGRFPHRNSILGRGMTQPEQAFLETGGFSG